MKSYPFVTEKYTTEVISLDRAKAWLRKDIPGYNGEDDNITELIYSAVDYVETECNISLGVSTYEWHADCLPCEIPDTFYVREIVSIQSLTGSTLAPVDSVNYSLFKNSKRRSTIQWSPDYSADVDVDGYVVRFKAGFESDKIPPRLLMAVRALIAAWDTDRDDSVSERKTVSDKILAPYVLAYAG